MFCFMIMVMVFVRVVLRESVKVCVRFMGWFRLSGYGYGYV